jgi:hypothetical protein
MDFWIGEDYMSLVGPVSIKLASRRWNCRGGIQSVDAGLRSSGEGDAGDLLEVVEEGEVVPVCEERCERGMLTLAEFEGEKPLGLQ